ncbi:MAG: hypothetical protein MK074_06590 [Phycisphaerales bacterium]|nr:hypothetical protein [Phycisphaerales bacterium]
MRPRALMIGSIATMLCVTVAGAETWSVEQDGSGDFNSLHAALVVANSGDTIEVGPGEYDNGLLLPMVNTAGMSLTIRSTHGADLTVLDSQENDRVFEVVGLPSAVVTIEGFTIRRGKAHSGAGLYVDGPEVFVNNCVFSDCHADYSGGAVWAESNATFEFCRFEDCTGQHQLPGPQADFFHAEGTAVIALNGTVICGYTTASNISVGELEKDDWTYNWAECDNCNDNCFDDVEEGTNFDPDAECDDGTGSMWPLSDLDDNGLWDQCEADCDNTNIKDVLEIAMGLTQDLDGNWRPDSCDPDCNGDGIPDAYELLFGDCNGNGIADACDVEEELLTDCDGNGIGDECQDDLEDCDGDGVPDLCQMNEGGDCNDNGILDLCEVLDGDKVDLDLNGYPDECDCLADITGDRNVFYDELILWIQNFGNSNGGTGDVDQSGIVDVRDLIYILTRWGNCPYDAPPDDDEEDDDP